ncbi:MAG: hypothetical protein QNJ36_03145 [Calothrix sp. MO_167.B42]|nr:hypothetical protein [Calothrix sp. MO_167.B42]
MKNKFTPEDFRDQLYSLHKLLSGLVDSENYQGFSNSQYAKNLDYTLDNALRALSQTEEAYSTQQQNLEE